MHFKCCSWVVTEPSEPVLIPKEEKVPRFSYRDLHFYWLFNDVTGLNLLSVPISGNIQNFVPILRIFCKFHKYLQLLYFAIVIFKWSDENKFEFYSIQYQNTCRTGAGPEQALVDTPCTDFLLGAHLHSSSQIVLIWGWLTWLVTR